jgi:hypothetical protein
MRATPARNEGGSADAVDIKATANARPRMSARKRFSFCRMPVIELAPVFSFGRVDRGLGDAPGARDMAAESRGMAEQVDIA